MNLLESVTSLFDTVILSIAGRIERAFDKSSPYKGDMVAALGSVRTISNLYASKNKVAIELPMKLSHRRVRNKDLL